MGIRRVASQYQVMEWVRYFSALPSPARVGDVKAMVRELGWSIYSETSRTVSMDNGFGPASAQAKFSRDGELRRIKALVCSYVKPDEEIEGEQLLDVFSNTVGFVEQVLGSPADRKPGDVPEVSWQASSYVISVLKFTEVVEVFIASQEHAEAMRETERLADL